MRILVTGHRGMLGSACVRVMKCKHDIVTTNIDLSDSGLVRDWFKMNEVDVVVHCAAKVGGVKANNEQPVEFIIENLRIQNAVIQGAAEAQVERFVNIGTSCLYPRETPLPVKETALLTGPLDPSVEAYAIAKLAGHALIKAHRTQYGRLRWWTAAPCNLYGYNDNYGPSAHVIPGLMARLTECSVNGKPLRVWGDGTALREFMFADDAAKAILLGIETYLVAPELVNIGTGVSTSIDNLVSTLCDVSDYHPDIVWDSSQPTGIKEKTFDISHLNDIGFKPSVDLFDGLFDVWNEFNRNPNPRFR